MPLDPAIASMLAPVNAEISATMTWLANYNASASTTTTATPTPTTVAPTPTPTTDPYPEYPEYPYPGYPGLPIGGWPTGGSGSPTETPDVLAEQVTDLFMIEKQSGQENSGTDAMFGNIFQQLQAKGVDFNSLTLTPEEKTALQNLYPTLFTASTNGSSGSSS